MINEPTHVRIAGAASYLPAEHRSTAELERLIDFHSPSFTPPAGLIEKRTGIGKRQVMADDEQASDLAVEAAHRLEPRPTFGLMPACTTPSANTSPRC